MLAIAPGWKLIGVSLVALTAAAFVGIVTAYTSSHRVVILRRSFALVALLALVTLAVVAIAGPGDWCGPGDAYSVPGCA